MNRFPASLCATALLLGACLAQTPNDPQAAATPQGASTPNAAPANQLPAGTIIPAELAKSIDAKKAKSGDQVVAKTTIDLRSKDGSTVIPKGAKVLGHVTDAKARGKDESGSMVAIAFDKVELKGGRDLQFNGGIQAIGKSEQNAAAATGGGSPMSESGGVPSGAPGQGGMGGARTGSTGAPPTGAGYPGNAPADSGTAASAGVGPLSPSSQGVVGMPGLSLQDSAQGSVITSSSGNVHLDSGTQLILRAK
ncbi:MAG TPA: TrbI/VirB10 family protein [Terriglobales bacterium]|nr:TrbI/VirB10 family protein [Terriglobales bacterium]